MHPHPPTPTPVQWRVRLKILENSLLGGGSEILILVRKGYIVRGGESCNFEVKIKTA